MSAVLSVSPAACRVGPVRCRASARRAALTPSVAARASRISAPMPTSRRAMAVSASTRKTVPERKEEAARAASPADLDPENRLGSAATAAMIPLLAAMPAFAEEVDGLAPNQFYVGDYGILVVSLAPIFLYALFTIYRTSFNPKAKISDFALGTATTIIFANIFSIVFLKIRWF